MKKTWMEMESDAAAYHDRWSTAERQRRTLKAGLLLLGAVVGCVVAFIAVVS